MMKTKIIIVIALILCCQISIQAQSTVENDTSIQVHSFLPQAGSFAIGVDATPVFNYLGNMFNNTVGNTLDLSRPAIYAKYYFSDKVALRAVVAISSTNNRDDFYVKDDAAWFVDPLSNKQVVDSRTVANSDHFTSLAIQRFIGNTRLRGFVGAQVLYGAQSSKSINGYANPMSELNPTPTIAPAFIYSAANERALEVATVKAYKVGAGAIAGFEYFVLPQLCIGGEISLNAIYSHKGQLYSKSERMVNNELVNVDKAISPGGNEFAVETFRFTPNGYTEQLGFYVMFHF